MGRVKNNRIGTVVKVHELDDSMWAKGMNKYVGEVGEVIDGMTYGTVRVYIIDGFVGEAGVPYLFPDECLEEV